MDATLIVRIGVVTEVKKEVCDDLHCESNALE
jgi:hypothetical protein